jgi:hypothetical protein
MFQVYLKNGERLWPASIFRQNALLAGKSMKDLGDIEEAIEQDDSIYIQASSSDREGNVLPDIHRIVPRDELFAIQGPIPFIQSHELSIKEVFGASAAARKWGLKGGGATIRKRFERGHFFDREIVKSDGVLIVTYPGMQRLFNAVPKDEWDIVPIYFVHKGISENEWFSEMLSDPKIKEDFERMANMSRSPKKVSNATFSDFADEEPDYEKIAVYLNSEDGIYQCFPDGSRIKVDKKIADLMGRPKDGEKSNWIISDKQVEFLKSILPNPSVAGPMPNTVKFHLRFGLISEEEYQAYEKGVSRLFKASEMPEGMKLTIVTPESLAAAVEAGEWPDKRLTIFRPEQDK